MSESHCMDCGSRWGALHRADCATHERDPVPSMKEINDALERWPEDQMSQHGTKRVPGFGAATGMHYAEDSDRGSALSQALVEKQPRYQDKAGEDWIDEFARTATADEFRGAMRFTVGKYNRRVGKKDSELSEVRKMRDYCQRWEAYLVAQGGEQ